MLDRHEFVLDMCELLAEFSNFSLDQPQTFRILIILMTQFTDIVVQNVFIARRVASILCSRLMQYRKDYEKMRRFSISFLNSAQFQFYFGYVFGSFFSIYGTFNIKVWLGFERVN